MFIYRDIKETDNVRSKVKWRGDWYECRNIEGEIPAGWFTLPKQSEIKEEPRKPGRPRK